MSLSRIWVSPVASWSRSQVRSCSSTFGVTAFLAILPALGRESMVRTGIGLSSHLWNSATHSGS